MKKLFLALVVILWSFGLTAQETIKTMFYNLLDFPEAIPANREILLAGILDTYQPDIFMVCELQSAEGAQLILSALNNDADLYEMAPFIPSASGAFEHQQLVYYKKSKMSLQDLEALPTEVRDINYYKLKLNTTDQDTDPVYINVFISHLKSSQGGANQQLRLDMVNTFLEKTETLDPDDFVIFSGDFNLYSSSEPAYQAMLNPDNHITMADPVNRPGTWHENLNFIDLHSQSTRIYSGPFGAGAGGGMDDRFDFIMISENMKTHPNLRYIPNTYRAYGNNGNCFKKNINDSSCRGYYSQDLRNKLYNMSDHLPIVMSLETTKDLLLNRPDFKALDIVSINNTWVQDFLYITIDQTQSEKDLTLEIYNTLGQKVLTVPVENKEHLSIDTSGFSNGIYYLKTSIPGTPTLKFIKAS